jgi:antitoxin Phd
MNVNVKNLVPITETNRNFSRVARMVDQDGAVVILKNNSPKYVILNYATFQEAESSDSDNVEAIGYRIMKDNWASFEKLQNALSKRAAKAGVKSAEDVDKLIKEVRQESRKEKRANQR